MFLMALETKDIQRTRKSIYGGWMKRKTSLRSFWRMVCSTVQWNCWSRPSVMTIAIESGPDDARVKKEYGVQTAGCGNLAGEVCNCKCRCAFNMGITDFWRQLYSFCIQETLLQQWSWLGGRPCFSWTVIVKKTCRVLVGNAVSSAWNEL